MKLFKKKASVEEEKQSAIAAIKVAQASAIEDIKKAASAARKGISCDICGANVYNKNWVHGMNGKAYCLDECWPKAVEEANKT